MSRKTGYELSGAHRTREASVGTFNSFARIMRELGLRHTSGILDRPQAFAGLTQRRTSEGIGQRTLANEMRDLRAVLKHVDKSIDFGHGDGRGRYIASVYVGR